MQNNEQGIQKAEGQEADAIVKTKVIMDTQEWQRKLPSAVVCGHCVNLGGFGLG